MNVFFTIDNVIITPSLEEGTILHGITRDAILKIAKKMGYKTEERPISIEELLQAYHNNTLQDMFGTGTAAVVYPINGFVYQGKTYDLSQLDRSISSKLKTELEGIKTGKITDEFGWIEKVNTSSTSSN
jgi:branched-chain amino acid aminotransferase